MRDENGLTTHAVYLESRCEGIELEFATGHEFNLPAGQSLVEVQVQAEALLNDFIGS